MVKKNVNEGTTAAGTLQPQNRSVMMNQVMAAMTGMGNEDMLDFFNKAMERYTPPTDNSGKNKASIAAKGTPVAKEEVDELFEGQDLSEDFKTKAHVIFEAAVNSRVLAETARIEEELAEKLDEEVEKINEEISNKVDEYLTYVAEQWMEENQLAIDQGIRSEIYENFINGLRQLFVDTGVNLPEEALNPVETLEKQVEELTSKLDESVKTTLNLTEEVENYKKQDIFTVVSEGLTDTQVEKLATLAEGLISENLDSYKEKLLVLKENVKPVKENKTIVEGVPSEEGEQVLNEDAGNQLDPRMKLYVSALSKSTKK